MDHTSGLYRFFWQERVPLLDCQPNDLIEIEVVSKQVRKAASEPGRAVPPPVRRSTIRRPGPVVTTAHPDGGSRVLSLL